MAVYLTGTEEGGSQPATQQASTPIPNQLPLPPSVESKSRRPRKSQMDFQDFTLYYGYTIQLT